MARSLSYFIIYSATLALVVNLAAAQTVHVVGDSFGWSIPQNPSFSYANWASGKTFMVGDILEFNFLTNQHDLVQVPKASYDDCSDDNVIGNVITVGPVNVTLDTAGERYYICSFGSHCEAGQKLSITVVSSSTTPGGAAPPPTMTPSPPPPTSTTPAPATPTACPPETSAGAPTAGVQPPRAGPTTPPPPFSASSTSLATSFLVIVICAALAFLF